MLLSAVDETILRYRMFEPGQQVGVAVSGGADSVCLLRVLLELAPRLGLHLSVLHLNHGLRGEESREDERFVRELAARLGLPAVVRAVDVAALPDNLEQAARHARIAFFREQLAGGLARIATGHTRDDQAETVLFRFLRGSGGAGLAAIRPVTTDGIVRPLLAAGRDDVERFLRQRGIVWREDSSNASLQFARNRIRHQLLPQLAREWNPAIGENLIAPPIGRWPRRNTGTPKSAGWLRISCWNAMARSWSRAEALRQLPLAVARRLVRYALERTKGDLRGVDFGHIAAILNLAASPLGHGRTQAPGVDVERSLDWVRFARPADGTGVFDGYRLAAPVPGLVPVPGTGFAISLELIEIAETLDAINSVYNNDKGCIDWSALPGSLEIRNWMPGDQYWPQGSTGEVKIKSLFQKARIPRWERRHWPVVTDGSAIVWARRFGPAMRFAAVPGCALVLRISESVVARMASNE